MEIAVYTVGFTQCLKIFLQFSTFLLVADFLNYGIGNVALAGVSLQQFVSAFA